MKKEAVSLLGLIALVATLPLPVLTVKPNRVAEGVALRLWDLPGAAALPALAVTIVLFACLILIPRQRNRLVLRSLLAGLTLGAAVAMIAVAGQSLLSVRDLRSGRVAPSAGFWTAVGGGYVILYDGLRRLKRGRVARSAVILIAIAAPVAALIVGPSESLGIVQEYLNRRPRFWQELAAHLALAGASVLGAVIIGVPLGMWSFRSRRAERPVFTITNGLQTIPSLAMFGLLIAPLAFISRQLPLLRAIGIRGVGSTPAIVALTLYGLLPIVRNTFIGLKSIDRAVVDAGRGMGMSRRELLAIVQIPIALPIILTGVRITAVQTIGNAAVAALIGARGLGNFVFQGLGQAAPDLIVLGVVPIVILAVVVDRGMDALISGLNPMSRARGRQ